MSDRSKPKGVPGDDEWDYQRAELHKPAGAQGRTVVSVSMGREEFQRIAKAAEHLGYRTSEFIRRAALAHTDESAVTVVFSATGGPGSILYRGEMDSSTGFSAETTRHEIEELNPAQSLLAIGH